MKDKLSIKKGTVQETLVFPLYGRSICNRKAPEVFGDTLAARIMEKTDYDFASANMGIGPTYVYGIRGEMLVDAAKAYLAQYPDAIIVNLGCGLDTSFRQLDNGRCRYVSLDFQEVIDFREKLFDRCDREMNLAADATDLTWMDKINAPEGAHVFIISGGVFYYLQPEAVKALVDSLARRFPGGGMIFDYENRKMVMQSNRLVNKAGNHGAQMYYYVEDADREIPSYSACIESVKLCKKLPAKFNCIPGLLRFIFNLEFKKGMMGYAEIRFKK